LSSDMLRILKVLHPSIQDSRRLIATAHTHRLRLPIHTRKLQGVPPKKVVGHAANRSDLRSQKS
jgi:hypothetical protein